ncbi:hypothetical protein AB0G02_19750 [Actinosynnema sp. NPDC023658]|uniref:hypothetical protein n=1 Tax=Actinosynnema sp. NPDC023658 TaxID=3155465 RepID=UPI0033DEEE65
MARRVDPGQIDLFADAADQPAPVAVSAERGRPSGYGGTPDLTVIVLDQILDGLIGQLDPSGRVVVLGGDGHCRHADDDVTDVVESLLTQRYAAQGEFTTQLHGAIRRNVYQVKLTNAGHRIRTRWFHLRGVR